MNYFVYVLRCSDNTFYCGFTTDLKRRVKEHNSDDSKTKYTRGRRPVKLVYSKEFDNKSQALKYEIYLKSLTRKQKEAWISGS